MSKRYRALPSTAVSECSRVMIAKPPLLWRIYMSIVQPAAVSLMCFPRFRSCAAITVEQKRRMR